MTVLLRLSLAILAALAVSGCQLLSLGVTEEFDLEPPDRFPEVIGVQLVSVDDRVYDVVVSISSPYDSPERYADGWRVLTADGQVLGVHTLAHDHANEQPFTRTQRGLVVPDDVAEVTIEGRDLANGFGGGTLLVTVPR